MADSNSVNISPGKCLTIIFAVLCTACIAGRQKPAEAVAGVLDLSGSPLNGESLPLGGYWAFYPQQLVPSFSAAKAPAHAYVGGVWNDHFPGGMGYGSYRLRLRLPGQGPFSIRIPEQGTAYALYCNGRKIASSGNVGTTEAEWEARLSVQRASLCAGPEVELVLQVANFGHRFGGAWHPPTIGTTQHMQREHERWWVIDLTLFGAHLILGLYHLALFVLRPSDRSTLYFSLWCFGNGIRLASIGDRLLNAIFPDLPGWIGHRVEYASLYACTVFAFLYVREIFPDHMNRWIFRFHVIGAGVLFVWAVGAPYQHFGKSLDFFYAIGATTAAYFLYLTVRVVFLRERDSIIFMIGMTLIFLGTVNDILYNNYFINTGLCAQYTFFAFMAIQAIVIARRFSASFQHRALLAERLETILGITRILTVMENSAAACATAFARICSLLETPGNGEIFLRTGAANQWVVHAVNGSPELGTGTVVAQDFHSTLERTSPDWRDGRLVLPCVSGGKSAGVFSLSAVPLRNWERESEVIIGVMDALALTLTASLRRKREKLEAVGQVAAEIVHDINNHCQVLLQTVQGTLPLSREMLSRGIEREATLLRDLALDILDFSKDGLILRTENLDLAAFGERLHTESVIFLAQRSVQLEFEWDATGKSTRIDAGRIRRMALNLVKNGAEAAPEGGRLKVSGHRENDLLYLIFEDNGPGISPSMLDRLFEPFASEKRGGTGLGLAIVKRIVDGHGGSIHVHTSSESGTRFTAILPV